MKLLQVQRLEKSLRIRAGSLSDLSDGYLTRSRRWREQGHLDIPSHLRDKLRKTSEIMDDTARDLREAMEKIDVDV